jgi:uncharacterized membrane protein YhiD involved in acid resistance
MESYVAEDVSILARLVVALALAGVVGWERQTIGK